MTGIFSWLAGIASGMRSYLFAFCLGVLLAGAGAGYLVHRMDEGAVAAMKLADQQAKTEAIKDAAAIQQSQDRANLNAALAEADAQQKIVTVTRTITREIPVHVPEIQSCIPYGLVRLLDDAATGSDPADIPPSPGQSDDACAPISWRAFASELADDYGAGRANAEQLNALEADVRALAAAANTKFNNGDDK